MFGYTAGDVASIATPFDVLVPEERMRAAEMMRRRLDGTADGVFRTVGLRKDGTRIDLEIYGARIEMGGKAAIVGTLIDISDRLRAETALRESEAQLRQAQKMEAVGQLAGGIAHDFNNLLTALMGHLELARCELERDHPAQHDLEGVLQAADRAATLTRQLLTVARRDTADPRPLDLNTSVRESNRLFARLLGERVSVELALAPALWATRADPGQIDQVLLNLVVNARDAMPKGGVVTIESANEYVAPEAVQGGAASIPPGDYVRLTVRDTGIGMSPATRARVFEPFFTT
jgi:PAS domain S-box-containing protein